jgi:hypothetical protein
VANHAMGTLVVFFSDGLGDFCFPVSLPAGMFLLSCQGVCLLAHKRTSDAISV